MHTGSVNLDAVLVTPLLALLPDAVVYHYHTVVSQAADDRLRDSSAGSNL